MEEVAAASKHRALDDLSAVETEVQTLGTRIDIPDVRGISKLVRNIDSSRLPWERAEIAAHAVREKWDIGIGTGPVTSKALADRLGFDIASFKDADATSASFGFGFRDPKTFKGLSVVFRARHPTSRRFALARLIADNAIASPRDRLLPTTEAKTVRQKFQRAFAQEFLCPFEELVEFAGTDHPSDDRIEEAAEHFDVSPLVIKSMLVNKGRLAREALGAVI